MGVEQLGVPNEGRGYEDSIEAFKMSHEQNSRQILNIAEGRKKTDPRPAYDPNHPDNRWPLQVHRADGTKDVGVTLLGVTIPSERHRITEENQQALKQAIADGYRREPFIKPQVAVLHPDAEKAALKATNENLQAQLNALADQNARIMEAIRRGVPLDSGLPAEDEDPDKDPDKKKGKNK